MSQEIVLFSCDKCRTDNVVTVSEYHKMKVNSPYYSSGGAGYTICINCQDEGWEMSCVKNADFCVWYFVNRKTKETIRAS